MNLFDRYSANCGLAMLFHSNGRQVVYEAKDAPPLTLTALVGDEQVNERKDPRSGKRMKVRGRTFTVMRNPKSQYGGIQDPRLRAVFHFDNRKYVTTDVVQQDALTTQLRGELAESRDQLIGSGK